MSMKIDDNSIASAAAGSQGAQGVMASGGSMLNDIQDFLSSQGIATAGLTLANSGAGSVTMTGSPTLISTAVQALEAAGASATVSLDGTSAVISMNSSSGGTTSAASSTNTGLNITDIGPNYGPNTNLSALLGASGTSTDSGLMKILKEMMAYLSGKHRPHHHHHETAPAVATTTGTTDNTSNTTVVSNAIDPTSSTDTTNTTT